MESDRSFWIRLLVFDFEIVPEPLFYLLVVALGDLRGVPIDQPGHELLGIESARYTSSTHVGGLHP